MAKPPVKKPSTEIVDVDSQESSVPTYLQNGGGTGLEGMDMDDFLVPRIKLLQAISEEVKNFDEAKAGIFWVTVLDEPLGDSIEFIPCVNKKRYLLLPPIGDSRGVLARADDAKTWSPAEGEWQVKLKGVKNPVTWTIKDPNVKRSGLTEFGSSNPDDPDSSPAATLFYDYLVYIPGRPDISPAMISLARSAAKKAKDLNGKLQFGNAPIQAQKITMTAIDDSSPEGPFYNYAFRKSGWASEAEFNTCVGISERFSGGFRARDEDNLSENERATGVVNSDRGEI